MCYYQMPLFTKETTFNIENNVRIQNELSSSPTLAYVTTKDDDLPKSPVLKPKRRRKSDKVNQPVVIYKWLCLMCFLKVYIRVLGMPAYKVMKH